MEWPHVFTMIKNMFDELEMFRGILYSKLQFRSGNTDIIKLITNDMTQILLSKSLLINKRDEDNSSSENEDIEWNCEKAHELREVLLFLMLNTDLSYHRNVKECNPNVEHLYKVFNLLPPFLFMEIIWTCQLENSFMEMLSYAPAWLSHPYYKEANHSLSSLSDPFVVVNKIESIFEAIILSIAMSHGKDQDSLNDIMLRETMPSYVDTILLHYATESEHIGKMKGAKLKQFKGRLTLNLLKMSATAIKFYKQRLVMPAECSIYKTFINKKLTCKHPPRKDLIRTLLLKVLNVLQNVLTSIDIDTFMEWTEIETEGGYDNLQQRIGALTYVLNDHLMVKNALVKHDITRELKVFIIEPIPFLQRLREATIGKLLNMLGDKTLLPDQMKHCFAEIFRRPIIYGNDECINNLILYADMLKLKHCKRIIGFMIVDLKRANLEYLECEETYDCDEDKYNNLVKLLYNIYKNFSIMKKIEFLMFRQKHFVNYAEIEFKLPEFKKRYHSFWNHFDENFDRDQFLLLCFESEDSMWCQLYAHILASNKFFDLAWQLSESYAETRLPIVMKKTLLIYKQISNKFYGNVFVNNLFRMSASTRTDLENEILKVMLKSTKKQKFTTAYEYIKLLSTISEHALKSSSKSYTFDENIVNVLNHVAFVMDKSLWKVRTFSYKRARVVSACQQFLEINSRDFAKKADTQTSKDISKFIGSLPYSRQVMYYMRVLFIQDKLLPFIIFMEVCFKKKQNDEQRNRMIATILMRATESEFINYARLAFVTPKNLFIIVHEMIYIAGKIDKQHAFNNFYYIYNAYMQFLTNALNNNDDYNKWHYDDLLDNIMNLITSSKKMHNHLLVNSSDLFLSWIKHNKDIGNQIIIKLKEMPSSTNLLDTLNKLNSVMTSTLPSSSSSSSNKAE